MRFKKFCALSFILASLLVLSGSSWAASYDPYHLYPRLDDTDLALVYSRYGNSDIGFFYQLRDITGASRRDSVAGPQWFATVYENYHYYYYFPEDDTHAGMYRRTMGGEIPEITFSSLADIVNGFNYVLAEEPQPYNAWIDRGLVYAPYYDVYPDPLESLCLVTTGGRAEFKVNFGNAYARHFPFWYGWGRGSNMRWWQNYKYDSINEPVYCIIEINSSNTNSADIYVRTGSGVNASYPLTYTYSASGDNYAIIRDTDKNIAYTVSGDNVYDSSNTLVYVISNDTKILDSDGQIAYTLEDDYASSNIKYLCDIRSVYENIEINFGDNYNVSINPSQETLTNPGEYHSVNVNVRSDNAESYGSTLGYITFRQRANLATGYSNYREVSPIPIVIANVSNGNASENPLIFDMTIYNQSGDLASRQKFTWDAQTSTTRNLGTFFTMTPYNSSSSNYRIETKITNRTGTRYELYPYSGTNYIIPERWEYDLTPDLYGTLPASFMLDAHSQIAPGLVTVYSNDFPLHTGNDTSESYRLYEYANTTPKDLRLQYKRVSGMTPQSSRITINTQGGSVGLQGFNMQFADVTQDNDETIYELTNLMGVPPVMISPEISAVTPAETYIRASAVTPFAINKAVPEEMVSYDHSVVPDYSDMSGDIPASLDVYTPNNIAVQPVAVRLKISRQSSLLVNRWDSLNESMTSSELFNRFSSFAAVWVRSAATREQDTNLFTAINNKGANVNSSAITASECFNAFISSNDLYLDFIVLIADATSINTNKTAYIEVFRDDRVPYILIGDGNVDGNWQLEFFVDATGENPGTRESDDITPTPTPVNSDDNDLPFVPVSGGGGGGGGCNSGMIALALLLPVLGFAITKKY